MNHWKNILVKVLWSIAAAALIVLFIIAWNTKVEKKYTAIQVELVGETTAALFMDEKEIAQILKDQGVQVGTTMSSVNLSAIEKYLEKIKWIQNAEIFTNNKQQLIVQIEQRVPIARLFCVSGTSVYIDKEGRQLPLKQLTVLRLPVFTGFPSDQEQLSKPDSTLLMDVLFFSNIIKEDSFFTAQIAQINIEPNGEFQLIPALGDHSVLIGTIDHLEDKLNRLYTFYKRVWVQSGINAYQVLDCRFDKQIVALKKGMLPIQYTVGMIPISKLDTLLNNKVAPLIEVPDTPKMLPAKLNAIPVVPPKKKIASVLTKKSTQKSLKVQSKKTVKTNNKPKNISLNNKKKTAKALMPKKTTSNNN